MSGEVIPLAELVKSGLPGAVVCRSPFSPVTPQPMNSHRLGSNALTRATAAVGHPIPDRDSLHIAVARVGKRFLGIDRNLLRKSHRFARFVARSRLTVTWTVRHAVVIEGVDRASCNATNDVDRASCFLTDCLG